MTDTKSAETKSFPARVQQHLSDLKVSVDHLQANLEGSSAKVAAGLGAKQEEARARMEGRKAQIDAANARMKERLDAKKAQTDATVAEWKAKRDVQRLERRAEDAEEYASAAFVIAWEAINEADAALLEALAARIDAEEAKQGTAPKQ